MSWSVSALGKPEAVAKSLAESFTRNKCMEPEETIRQLAGQAIATSLAAFPPATVVKVSASGNQSTATDGRAVNQLSVTIEPLYQFLE